MKFKLKFSLVLIAGILGWLNTRARNSGDAEVRSGDAAPAYYDLILRVGADVDEDISYLESCGVIVFNHRDNICLTLYPETLDINYVVDNLPSFSNIQENTPEAPMSVKRTDLRNRTDLRRRFGRGVGQNPGYGTFTVPTMDVARNCYDFYATTRSAEVSGHFPGLDGRGVVVGFADIGFDARHINFRSADGRELRVKRVVNILEEQGRKEVYSTPEEILAWHTDTEDNFHATHVAGIMAGGYMDCDYHGMAPGAEIVATTSRLTDVGILAGVEEIIAYAKESGKPAVVNISLGNYTGPHDGTSLFAQYLDKCAEDAIICISSGNEGKTLGHIGLSLTETKPFLQMQFASSDWAHFDMYGVTDIYADSSEPFEVTLYMREDGSRAQNFKYETPRLDFTKNGMYVLTSNADLASQPGYIYSDVFAECMQGEIYAFGEIDPENGRYHVQVFYNTHSERKAQDKYGWAHYRIGAMAYGKPGQRIDAFADCSRSRFERVAGNPVNPDTSCSLSDMATGHNTISVGFYNGRPPVEMSGGGAWGEENVNVVNANSGYATLPDGRVMPLTIGPGMPVISSLSGAYIRKYSQEGMSCYSTTGANADAASGANSENTQDEVYYWGPYGGSSMSCPYVAGAMALFLQVNPDMTSAEARTLVARTNDSEGHPYSADPRNAAGFFNPSKGLLELVSELPTSVGGVLDETVDFLVVVENGEIKIANPSSRLIHVGVFAADGRTLRSFDAGSEKLISIPDDELPGGVAIIRVSDGISSPYVMKLIK